MVLAMQRVNARGEVNWQLEPIIGNLSVRGR
jgi:hypothetical protein